MGVESGTYVNDFDTTLPTSTDLRSQGDDHLRLIKTFLKNTFTRGTRAMSIPGALAKSANYTVVKDDSEHTIYVSTAGGVCTMTLPTLVALDAGWKVHFVKTNSGANPVFIAPPSGTINSGGISGLAKARRSIPGVRVTAIWDGTGWFVTRAISVPIASVVDCYSSTLPAGFEWPNGQTLASAATDYPEYNSVIGSGITPDYRGRVVAGRGDMGGVDAARLTASFFGSSGTVIGSVGGLESHTLTTAQLASHTHLNTLTDPTHAHSVTGGVIGGTSTNVVPLNSGAANAPGPTTASIAISAASTGISINNVAAGSGNAHNNVQPTIIANKLVVVE